VQIYARKGAKKVTSPAEEEALPTAPPEQIVTTVKQLAPIVEQTLRPIKRWLLIATIGPVIVTAIATTPGLLAIYNQQLYQRQELEYRKLQQQREIETSLILEALRDPEQATSRLRLLVESGRIADPDGRILSQVRVDRVRPNWKMTFSPGD
jgi:hypothetical protein